MPTYSERPSGGSHACSFMMIPSPAGKGCGFGRRSWQNRRSFSFFFCWGRALRSAPLRSIRTDGVMGPPTPRWGPARGSTSRLARANPRSLQTPTHNLPTPTCLDPQTNLRSPLSPSRPQSHFFSLHPPHSFYFIFFCFLSLSSHSTRRRRDHEKRSDDGRRSRPPFGPICKYFCWSANISSKVKRGVVRRDVDGGREVAEGGEEAAVGGAAPP